MVVEVRKVVELGLGEEVIVEERSGEMRMRSAGLDAEEWSQGSEHMLPPAVE